MAHHPVIDVMVNVPGIVREPGMVRDGMFLEDGGCFDADDFCTVFFGARFNRSADQMFIRIAVSKLH